LFGFVFAVKTSYFTHFYPFPTIVSPSGTFWSAAIHRRFCPRTTYPIGTVNNVVDPTNYLLECGDESPHSKTNTPKQTPSAMNDSTSYTRRLRNVRLLLGFFIAALVVSGLTAFPLQWEIQQLNVWFGPDTTVGNAFPGLAHWLAYVKEGLEVTGRNYPFLAYGTDWLAFAHLVIAVAFLGPLKDPVKNIWVVEFGMIACLMVIPLTLICGPIRGIPLFWQLIDCSFGIIGIIPLAFVRQMILNLGRGNISPATMA
jgi:hypothetical protein